MGVISLRRRIEPSLKVDVYEVKLGDEFLMSSLFTVAEVELARLGLAQADDADLGRDVYGDFCVSCHGRDMINPGGVTFDLRKFPPGEHDRFVRSVTNGKNQMPPWGDLLKGDDIEALWAYVTTGEKK